MQNDEWVTVISVEFVQNAYMIRSQLELEGFEVNLLDELTAQVAPHYSFASGGVRIQVKKSELLEASNYLTSLGYELTKQQSRSKWLSYISELTLKIPMIKRLRFKIRILVSVALLFSLIILPFAINSIQSVEETLYGTRWCVAEVNHHGKIVSPSKQVAYISLNDCLHSLLIQSGTFCLVPPYGDDSIMTDWEISSDEITVTPTNRGIEFMPTGENNLFIDTFTYELTRNELILTSKKTKISLVRYEVSY